MTNSVNVKRSLKDYFWLTAKGFSMGMADIVPGVSGGTMAFILGVYEELIEAIHAVDAKFVQLVLSLKWKQAMGQIPWRFLLALGLGIGLAVLSLSNLLHWALDTHASLVWAFFFGLILASILVIRKRVSNWSIINLSAAIIFSLVGYFLVGIAPAETPHTPLLLFLSGALAICAMILPGISGAFILVLLGKYRYILGAVVAGDIFTLALVGSGAIIGLISFARLIRWMLHKNHDLTISILTGFLIGSLRKVWPWKFVQEVADMPVKEVNFLPNTLSLELMLAVIFMITGIGLVLLLERQAEIIPQKSS